MSNSSSQQRNALHVDIYIHISYSYMHCKTLLLQIISDLLLHWASSRWGIIRSSSCSSKSIERYLYACAWQKTRCLYRKIIRWKNSSNKCTRMSVLVTRWNGVVRLMAFVFYTAMLLGVPVIYFCGALARHMPVSWNFISASMPW